MRQEQVGIKGSKFVTVISPMRSVTYRTIAVICEKCFILTGILETQKIAPLSHPDELGKLDAKHVLTTIVSFRRLSQANIVPAERLGFATLRGVGPAKDKNGFHSKRDSGKACGALDYDNG